MSGVAQVADFELVERHEAWTPSGPVTTRLPDPEIELLESRSMATVAEPGTMALFGLATGTWMAGAAFGGFVTLATEPALAVVLIAFGGVAQFIGGLVAYRRANALTSNAFCCYGSYNTIVGTILLLEAGGLMVHGGGAATILGWLNCTFAFISLALMLAALSRNVMSAGIFGCLMAGYALIGTSQFYVGPNAHASSAGGVAAAGGALLFAAAFLAFYMGMALVVNSTWKRSRLPLFGEA